MGEHGWAIGIDVGGTKIAAGLVDPETGRTTGRRTMPTGADRGGAAVLADVEAVAGDLADEARARGRTVAAVGVGVPELVDPEGRIGSGHAFDWRGLPVSGRLGEIAPATIEADVRAAALAEARFGAGQPFASFAYVSVGTGISSTLVLDGRPWRGARGAALVLSTGPTSVPCPRCGGLEPFVLEEYASGPGLVRRHAELTGRAANGAKEVVAAAAAGEPEAVAVVETAAVALGSAVGFLVNVADPTAIVVGGGLGSAPGPFWDHLVAATRRHVWNPEAQSLPILQARLGPDAGWIGAALAAVDEGTAADRSGGMDRRPLAAAGRR